MTSPMPRETRAFRAVYALLVLALVACSTFAFIAGQEWIWEQNVSFAIAFVFLGIVTVLIFTLAWMDSTSRAGDHEFMRGHGH